MLLLLACGQAPAAAPGPTRVVAIGDLHADLDNAEQALRLAGLVDEGGSWIAGETTFVQTGDVFDRGPDSRAIYERLRALQAEAEQAGGRVVLLLGNHEVMNLQGDWRYVHPGDVEAFGGLEPRKAALAPDGAWGQWLSGLDAVAVVDDTVFVHGGVAPAWAEHGVEALNAQVHSALRSPSEVVGETGPLWFRGFVQAPEVDACPALEKSLTALGARRMVVGHTTQRDGRIHVRCGGRLHVIDVGIADHYGANIAVWESLGGDARALYPGGAEDLEDPSP